MENTNTSKRSPLPYFVTIFILIFAGLGVYYFFSSKNQIPDEFYVAYQSQNQSAKDLLRSYVFDFGSLGEKVQQKNLTGALSQVSQGDDVRKKSVISLQDLSQKTAKVTAFTPLIQDQKLHELSQKLSDLLLQRNKLLQDVLDEEGQVFTVLANYYVATLSQKTITLPDTLPNVINDIEVKMQQVTGVQGQIDDIYNTLILASGKDQKSLDTAESIRMSLSATPTLVPTIIPTLIPTSAEPVGPIASSSAAEEQNASSSAVQQ